MKFLIAIASVIAVTHAHSPVLLWPAEEFAVPAGQSALDSMNLDDFTRLFEGKKIIVFHKKQFMLEEISYPKKQLSYLQSVDAIALQGVKSIHHFVSGLTSSDNLQFVRLADGPLDEQQEEIKNTMASNPGFAAILVGSGSHRSRREAPADGPLCASNPGDSCMAYVGSITLSGKNSGDKPKCSVTCQNDSKLTIKIEGLTDLTVEKDKDEKSGGYSISVSAPYQIDSDTTWAPEGFSYSCMALELIPKEKTPGEKPSITLNRLQLFVGTPTTPNEFPESYDCATWFTPAIWMGVVMALFYISLLFGAVVFLLDVKTNDRFDDPKGKTITVNVAE